MTKSSQILLYQTEDGKTKVEVRLENDSLWLTQAQLAELFQTTPQNITLHLKNIYDSEELDSEATCKEYLQVQTEGDRQVSRNRKFYNLQAIIAVGYRVESHRGTQFRRWATERLNEYLVKGFTLDDERLKQGGAKNEYFDELLERIRDIRSSERNFYRKICDIYRTSIDYDPRAEMTEKFFQTVQNKMHWAIHGHTAAEVVHQRADAVQPNMGLTSWKGDKITKADVAVAKNYLSETEIRKLNLIVSQYLDFAELQAMEHNPMHMRDWIYKLDNFLRAGDRAILDNAGSISAEEAKLKAEKEYFLYREKQRLIEDAKDDDKLLAEMRLIENKKK